MEDVSSGGCGSMREAYYITIVLFLLDKYTLCHYILDYKLGCKKVKKKSPEIFDKSFFFSFFIIVIPPLLLNTATREEVSYK